jgi:hypothetical protein
VQKRYASSAPGLETSPGSFDRFSRKTTLFFTGHQKKDFCLLCIAFCQATIRVVGLHPREPVAANKGSRRGAGAGRARSDPR